MEFVSFEEFQSIAAIDKYYHRSRWDLYSKVLEQLSTCGADAILELGAYRFPLVKGGDTMDKMADFHPTYVQNARETPWPIRNGQYDMFVALQVWEHLEGRQVEAFREVKRITRAAILSFPYRWNCPKNPSHHGITEETIAAWTEGETPDEITIVPSTNNHRRIIYRFDFTKPAKLKASLLNKKSNRTRPCEEPIPTLRREPAECRFRTAVNEKDGQEFARCQFVEDLFEKAGAPFESSVSRSACEACVEEPEPSPSNLNTVASSLIFSQTIQIGETTELSTQLRKLQRQAEKGLRLVVRNPTIIQPKTRSFGDCIFLGEKVKANSPGGIFSCSHARHSETSDSKCFLCSDHRDEEYDGSNSFLKRLPLKQKATPVKSWMVGVTTAPRRTPTIDLTLDSLRRAGWPSPWLFLDSAVEVAQRHAHLPVTFREASTGAWPNYFLSLSELIMRNPDADAYMMVQDDVELTNLENLRNYLEQVLWPDDDVGIVSLFCSSVYHKEQEGWHILNEKWVWGAVAMIFSNSAAWNFISDKNVIEHRKKGRFDGTRNIDVTIGEWLQRSQKKILYPVPSLSRHLGETSTLWEEATADGKRQAEKFIS